MEFHPNTQKCLNKLESLKDIKEMVNFVDFEITQIYLDNRNSIEDLIGYHNDLLYIQSILAGKQVCRLEPEYSNGRFEHIQIKMDAILNSNY